MEHVELLAPRMHGLPLSDAAMRDIREQRPESPLYEDALSYLADQLRAEDPYFNEYSHAERKRVVTHYVLDLDS